MDHLVTTTHSLMSRWPEAAVILGWDKNQLPLAALLQALPRFSQIVSNHTHGVKIIDVIITSCAKLYAVPEISATVLVENPLRAKPSHRVPVARPLASAGGAAVNSYEERVYRPLPEPGKRKFMTWVHPDDWGDISDKNNPTEQFEPFEEIIEEKVNIFLPERKVRVSK